MAFFPGGPFWVADNASNPTGVSTLYDGTGSKIALTVNIPFPAGDTNPGAPGPSGMVWNGNPLAFIVGNTGLSNAAPALFYLGDRRRNDRGMAAEVRCIEKNSAAVGADRESFVHRIGSAAAVYKVRVGYDGHCLGDRAQVFLPAKSRFGTPPLLPMPRSTRNSSTTKSQPDSRRSEFRISMANYG